MTGASAASVDVHLLRRRGDAWEVLVLQRGAGTRCTGAWEVVHGHIEPGELPADAAVREVLEETGLRVERLYNIAVQPFYLHTIDLVTLAIGFAAVVRDGPITLGAEHARAEWLPADAALVRLSWPRTRRAVRDALVLLAGGDAGPVEDVLRVR